MFRPDPIKMGPKKVREFKAEEYYFATDAYREEKSGRVLKSIYLRPLGTEAVAQYYREKYHADITIYDDSEKLCEFLASFKIPENTRKAFVLITGDETPHAIPIVYINENKEEGLLFANSSGTTDDHARYWAENFKKPFYYVSEMRQADRVSCYVDALTFSRDVTALDEKTGNYNFPNLLTKLKSRVKKIDEGLFQVKLPDELLKTAQIPEFIDSHKEHPERKMHKDETLSLFRKRYTDGGSFIISGGRRGREIKKENPPNYLRTKGLKLTNIIEIQFYINELQTILGDSWTTDLRKQFVRDAKAAFVAQPNIYTFAQAFLLKIKEARIPFLGERPTFT